MTPLLTIAGAAALAVAAAVLLDWPFAREVADLARRLDRLDADASRLRAERDAMRALLAELVRADRADNGPLLFALEAAQVARGAAALLGLAPAAAAPTAAPGGPPCGNCGAPTHLIDAGRSHGHHRCFGCGDVSPLAGPDRIVTDYEEAD